MKKPEPIAIVGIGCRFPGGADSPETFWRLLRDGVDAVSDIPEDRADLRALYDSRPGTPGRIASTQGGFLSNLDRIDADFFGVSPREAQALDPQQRLLLETTWEAFEDAGIPPGGLASRRVGVFVGMWTNEYEDRMFSSTSDIDLYMTTGGGRYAASGRISYVFDLRGPSMTLDTACSSSLVAVHLAVQSLRAGESDLAVAGAANLILTPHISIGYSRSRMLSPDGRCKFGDASANGYVRSEAVGVLLLKPLDRAMADGDPIHAVIRGSAVNNDGQSSGLLVAPGAGAQEAMLREAYRSAGVNPAEVTYVEAHGTGTGVGDPVELEALGAVLGEGRDPRHPCLVGSVKTNIGHAEAASGLVGLVKAALSLEHREIPASLHFKTPNPRVPWATLPLRIQAERIPWPADAPTPALAGVNSFGVTGTNSHVVLEEPPRRPRLQRAPSVNRPYVLPLSAATERALEHVARAWRGQLAAPDAAVVDICHTASVRRTHLATRLAVVGNDGASLVRAIDRHLAGEPTREAVAGKVDTSRNHSVAFVFSGQGGQWAGMGLGLSDREPEFRDALEACDRAIHAEAGFSIIDELGKDKGHSRLEHVEILQPVIFGMQVALARLWQDLGVTPAAVVGHSIGEIAAAHIAGILSLSDAAMVICTRSKLQSRVSGQGAMAVVGLTPGEASQEIASLRSGLVVAGNNSERSTVVAGEPAAVDAFVTSLEARGTFARRVNVNVAYHSPQMDPLRPELVASLSGLSSKPGAIEFVSTVTGKTLGGARADAEYWGRNLREPVVFSAAMRHVRERGFDVFVEIGPHPVLTHAIREDGGPGVTAVSSTRRDEDEQRAMLESLGAVFAAGGGIDWRALHRDGSYVAMPTYPWQRERFWHEGAAVVAPVALDKGLERGGASDMPATEPLAVVWRESALETRGAAGHPPIVYLGSDTRTAAELDATFCGDPLSDARSARKLLDRVLPRSGPAHVVYGWSRASAESVEEDYCNGPLGLLALVQALVGGGDESRVRLWLLGETPSASSFNGASAMVDGFGRVVAGEHPKLRCTNVSLSSVTASADWKALARAIASDDDENQLRFDGGRRFVKRLERPEPLGARRELRRDVTYLITGGVGGLGLVTARHLVEEHGIESVVLMSRREPGAAAGDAIKRLEASGARVRAVQADVADRAALGNVLDDIAASGAPLCGVVHAAGALHDATLMRMTPQAFRDAAAAKVEGARHLHELTEGLPLDTFVFYSSVVPLLGLPGQANYAAANTYLDHLAAHRRAKGLAATSIAWGPWSEVGMAAADETRGGRLSASGLTNVRPDEAARRLGRILRTTPAYTASFDVDWTLFAAAFPHVAAWPMLRGVVGSASASGLAAAGGIRDASLQVEVGRARLRFLEDRVTDIVAAVVRRSPGQIDRDKPFRALGIDSLMGLEVRNRVEQAFGISIAATLIWNFPTIHSLAPELARRAAIPLEVVEDAATAAKATTSDVGDDHEVLARLLREVEAMSDEDAERSVETVANPKGGA